MGLKLAFSLGWVSVLWEYVF